MAVVNPELDCVSFQKHSGCGCCSGLHCEPGSPPLRRSQQHRLGWLRNISQRGKEAVWQVHFPFLVNTDHYRGSELPINFRVVFAMQL